MPDALSKTIPIWQVAIVTTRRLLNLRTDHSVVLNQVHCDQSSYAETQPRPFGERMEY